MRTRGSSRLALALVACSLAFPVRAADEQVFAGIAFGDSSEVVSRKIRAHLDGGIFRRECYKCPVHVAIGGTRSGFEALSFSLTDEFGDLEVSVEVPDWAEPNRIHRFIIFDAYFQPIAYSKVFHVTDAEGLIWRRGEITHRNTRCAVLLTGEGEDHVLIGDVEVLRIGAKYNVRGRVGDDAGRCEDHVASQASIAVISIEPNF